MSLTPSQLFEEELCELVQSLKLARSLLSTSKSLSIEVNRQTTFCVKSERESTQLS